MIRVSSPQMEQQYTGWHFSNGRESYGFEREITTGTVLSVRAPLDMCVHGLHASAQPLDALIYGSGPIASLVRLDGQVIIGDDKACATKRTHLVVFDASAILHEFAFQCAEDALSLQRGLEPDPRSVAAIEIKRRWLRGKATDAELLAAGHAARSAAMWAAGPAWAAWAMALAAQANAAWAAAGAAKAAEADSATARDAQNTRLEAMLKQEAEYD